MSQLTNTERVAVALFGWTHVTPISEDYDADVRAVFSKAGQIVCMLELDPPHRFPVSVNGETVTGWPDFTDERLAPYWCDRMQRELAEQIRNGEEVYALALTHIVKSTEDPDWLALTKMQKVSWSACLHATPTQRLEAAVRVLDEVGL